MQVVKKQKNREESIPVITLNDGGITLQPILIETKQNLGSQLQSTKKEIERSFVPILPAPPNVLTIGGKFS